LKLPHDEILKYVENLEKQSKLFKKEIFKICWYMRGINPSDAMMLSYEDRELIGDIIKENLETTKKTNLPFF
jgi:hypothetical protein